MNDVTGADGELVDRLVSIIEIAPNWYDLSFYLEFAVGGSELGSVMVDTGREYPPGSIGAERAKNHQLVSREDYFSLVRSRLRSITASGVREDFLVRSLCFELRRMLTSFTNIDQGNENRARLREHFEQVASDPFELSRLREDFADRHPETANQSDEEFASHLNSFIDRLSDVDADEELQIWSHIHYLDEAISDHLSNETIDDWFEKVADALSRRRDIN